MKKIKVNRNHILLGGLALAGAAIFIHYQKCGVLKPLFKNQCDGKSVYDMGPSIADPDPFVLQQLEEAMSTRTLTDDYVQTYNRWINGYREKPTMFPENYYELPFRYPGPEKGILTSPGVPDSFGSNPINPEPNYWDRWIRQSFSF
jgi:hypothetical protein